MTGKVLLIISIVLAFTFICPVTNINHDIHHHSDVNVTFDVDVVQFNSSNSKLSSTTRCWQCGRTIYRDTTPNCRICGWDICKSCRACSYECSGYTPIPNQPSTPNSPSNPNYESVFKFIFFILIGGGLFVGFWTLVFKGTGKIFDKINKWKNSHKISLSNKKKYMLLLAWIVTVIYIYIFSLFTFRSLNGPVVLTKLSISFSLIACWVIHSKTLDVFLEGLEGFLVSVSTFISFGTIIGEVERLRSGMIYLFLLQAFWIILIIFIVIKRGIYKNKY